VKALVTGGAGFIGSAIAAALVERGDEVVVMDNLSNGRIEAVPAGVEMIEGDLRDPARVAEACDGAEVVFHEAAIRSVPRSVEEPLLTNDNNVTGTLNLLAAAAQAGVRRVLYASSSSVYGDVEDPVKEEGLRPQPRSPYAVSKLAGEHYAVVWAHLHLVETVSLRYFNVFGPGQHADSKYAAVFPAFIDALSRDVAPEVHWDGEQSRDFTYIDDVVEANLLAATADGVNGAVLNIAGGTSRTVNEVLRAVSDAVGVWVEPRSAPKRAGDVRSSKAEISAARELLGWVPHDAWDDQVKATVAWFTSG
jgi:UDP-glucose 4-epimerase